MYWYGNKLCRLHVSHPRGIMAVLDLIILRVWKKDLDSYRPPFPPNRLRNGLQRTFWKNTLALLAAHTRNPLHNSWVTYITVLVYSYTIKKCFENSESFDESFIAPPSPKRQRAPPPKSICSSGFKGYPLAQGRASHMGRPLSSYLT